MSSLVSLQLLGIRSFGPDEEDVGIVKFLSPITLILGQNGCGKTTLIESLKFAACGDLPDNTNRGSGFLFDPHLADSVETRGFVKLKFNDVNGDSLVITRPMQVTQKPKNLEFKRLDSAIKLTKPNRESTSLSSRCSDIDNLVTTSLGVSKAILNNVIFCHQEDSSWPLDEGKKVKDRFDAIFDSKKYNTCLENIRKLRKENMVDLRIMKTELQNLSERKNEASSKRAMLSECESKIAASRDRVKSLRDKLLPLTTRLREIAEKEDSIGKLQTEHETQKVRMKAVQDVIKDLKSRIQFEFSGTDKELEDALNNFHSELIGKEEQFNKTSIELDQVEVDIKATRGKVDKENSKVSELTRDIDRYNERLDNRNKNLLSLCEDLHLDNVSASDLRKNSSEFDKAFHSVDAAMVLREEDIADMKSEHEAIISQLQMKVDELREEKVKKESGVHHKKQQIVNIHKECGKLKKDIDEVDRSAESLGKLESKLERVKRELDDLNSNSNTNQMDSDIKKMKFERDKLEEELASVEKEVQSMQKLSSIKTEIGVQKDAKIAKENDAKKLMRRHQDFLNQLLGEVPEQGLKIKFQSAISKLSGLIRTKKEEMKITEKEITKLETQKSHLSDKIRQARQNLTSDECLIEQECGNKDYNTCLSELSAKVQELQDQKGTFSSSEYMFRKYVQKLEQPDPCCPLCQRDFPNEDNVSNLILELSLKMGELPSKLRTCKEELEEAQEKYEKFLQLKPKYDKLSHLKDVEIPSIQSELEKVDSKLEAARKKLTELNKALSEPQNNEETAKSIQGDVILMDQYWSDIKKLDRELQKLEAKLPPGSERCSLDEALNEQKELRSRVTVTRQSLEDLQTKLTSITNKKHKLQQEKNTIQEEQMKISGNVQMRSQLSEKLRENENLLDSLQSDIDKGNKELKELIEKLEIASKEVKSQFENNADILQNSMSKVKIARGKFNDIKEINKLIRTFESSGGVEKMSSLQKNLSNLKEQEERLQERKECLLSEKDQLKSDLASQKTRERDLEDNIKMRTKILEEKDLSTKIESMKLVIGGMDYVSITLEKNKLRTEEESINRERAHADGRQRELENTIASINTELNKDIYKNADKNYKDKFVQIKIEELAIDDLNKYYVALDWALTHFHQEKMKAINSTIRDLWRQIYQGNDIDSIEIKTDVDLSANADKRRTYNYRVIQKKNGIEMEMRGRCSAGQKVLACLIIRMALAETFSANCGVLALDEPTTNLDQANINSLSEALVQIVTKRCVQKNFQLIIISHDQAFLDVLQRIDKAPYYYRISRNHKGRSRIEKVPVLGVGDSF